MFALQTPAVTNGGNQRITVLENRTQELVTKEVPSISIQAPPIVPLPAIPSPPIDRERLNIAILTGIAYLNRICDPVTGFQNTSIGKSRTDLQVKEYYPEIFTSTLALDLLSNELTETNITNLYSFVMPDYKYGSINFNKGGDELVPDDVDCTALAGAVFLRDGRLQNGKQLLDMVRLILLNTNVDGIIETYFPPRGIRSNRLDPATTSNVMRFIYMTGYESEATKTEDYLYNCLKTGEYLDKCYYYVCPEAFFNFLSTAIILNQKARDRFQALLLENILKRIRVVDHPIDCAMRILALGNLGLLDDDDLRPDVDFNVHSMLAMRKDNDSGAFRDDCLFRLGRSEVFFGGDAVSTIFVIAALKMYYEACNINNKD